MKTERVPLAEAAKELGCRPQAVREHMKRGIWDLGTVVPVVGPRGSRKYTYFIFRHKLDKLVGKEQGQK